jgi:hypothetical protein
MVWGYSFLSKRIIDPAWEHLKAILQVKGGTSHRKIDGVQDYPGRIYKSLFC